MNGYERTDLACEMPDNASQKGVRLKKKRYAGIEAEEAIISPGEGESASGRPAGRYATLHPDKIWLMDKKESARAAEAIAALLFDFLTESTGEAPGTHTAVLVAGLGNRFITSDSIGPRTVDRVTVTNHAADTDSLPSLLGCARVSAIAPGVVGQTGIEAAAIIRDTAKAVKANAIIAVDALAARSTVRLGTTVQITDTGIRPGSGIGIRRTAVTKENAGVPVIAIGVPTAVDSATLVFDALRKADIDSPSDALVRVLEEGRSYIVSPRESDLIADASSALLAAAINRVLTPALT